MLDRGRVIEQGTHDQLLMKHEKYWDLFFTQMDHEESSVTDGSNL
jgi:ABC-type multidrug transport system fused ATPase/permease subunit